MFKDPIVKSGIKATIILVSCLALCKYTAGYFSCVMLAFGLWFGLQNRIGLCLCSYAFFPFIIIFNPMILPKPPVLALLMRIGPLIITGALIMSASRRRGREKLPLGMMFAFLFVAMISSLFGYCFQISIFKIINFAIFIIGIVMGTQNLDKRPQDLVILRSFFYGLAIIVVFGGICTLPFPAIAYPLNAKWLYLQGMGVEDANAVMRETMNQQVTLFAGVCGHSQMLAPLLSCLFGFVACDTLFVERKVNLMSGSLLACMPVLLYLTRSRTGLVSFMCAVFMVFIFAKNKFRLPQRVKIKINQLSWLALLVLVCVGVVGQVKSQLLTRWIFKVNTIESMNAGEAVANVTATRMGMVEQLTYDFKQNPVTGMGFQVNKDSKQHLKGLLTISAPIEKGLIPLMILGETGAMGALVFIGFLFSFYSTCIRKRYIVSATMFTILLATNMGEATFFSPGGPGGIMWMFCAVGGFAVDMMVLHRRSIEQQMEMMRQEQMMMQYRAEHGMEG